MTVTLWAIITDTRVGYSIASEVSFHSSDDSARCNVSKLLKLKTIAKVIYDHEVLLSIQCEQVGTYQGREGISCESMGSVGRSAWYWLQIPHDKQVSRMSDCISGQKRHSCALLLLLSEP